MQSDSDANEHFGSRAPAYLRPLNLLLVFGGGALGVAARELLMFAIPDVSGIPIAVLLANLVGAFLLGLLLQKLMPNDERRQRWRLLLGTGLLGGFTTYSALAQAVAIMLMGGEILLALGYGIGTLLLGGLATWGGIAVGDRV